MEGGVKKSVTTPRQTTLKCSTCSDYSKANDLKMPMGFRVLGF